MRLKRMELSIIMVVIMIESMIMMPVVFGDAPDQYEVTVATGQNTALLSTNTSFGIVLAGTTNEIVDAFNLTNSGNNVAIINAKFTTFNGSTYGFNSTSGPLGGDNFSMTAVYANSYYTLKNTDINTEIVNSNVAADNVADIWKVRLVVPAGHAAATYTGTVQLTFSNEV